MVSQDEWVKRIVEKFIERSIHESYAVSDIQSFMASFGSVVDSNFRKAWNHLVKSKLIIEAHGSNGKIFLLNSWGKATEIRNIFMSAPVPEKAEIIRPDEKYFKNLEERFIHATDNAWPNQGYYYCCTRKSKPEYWIVLFRSKPNKKHTPYDLGSIRDPTSRISTMWKVIIQVWKDNNKEPIFKKMAEDRDQKTFGNNRQPGTAGFIIFWKFGWIKEVSRKGKQIFYQIVDDKSHRKLIAKEMPICPMCSLPAPDNFCLKCDKSV